MSRLRWKVSCFIRLTKLKKLYEHKGLEFNHSPEVNLENDPKVTRCVKTIF